MTFTPSLSNRFPVLSLYPQLCCPNSQLDQQMIEIYRNIESFTGASPSHTDPVKFSKVLPWGRGEEGGRGPANQAKESGRKERVENSRVYPLLHEWTFGRPVLTLRCINTLLSCLAYPRPHKPTKAETTLCPFCYQGMVQCLVQDRCLHILQHCWMSQFTEGVNQIWFSETYLLYEVGCSQLGFFSHDGLIDLLSFQYPGYEILLWGHCDACTCI